MTQQDDPTDAQLEGWLRASATMEDAPAAVILRAAALAQPAAAAPGLLQRLTAILSFDSDGAGGLAFGLRTPGAPTRQLLHTCGERDIDLRIVPIAGSLPPTCQLRGQLLGPETAGVVELHGDAAADVRRVPLGESADFCFDEVPAGRYRLHFHLPDVLIELPEFEL